MYPLKKSTALNVPFFLHDSAGDAVTGQADGTFTKRISKNGAAFAAMTVTISELENGWYQLPLSTAHTDTNGVLTITLLHSGSGKQVNLQFRVHDRLPDDLAFPNVSGRGIDVEAGGCVGIDWANINGSTSGASLPNTTIGTVSTVSDKTGYALSAAGIDAIWDEVITTSAHNGANSAGQRLRQASDATGVLNEGTAQGGAAGTIQLAAAADATNDDIYEDAYVAIIGGTGAGQVRLITSYTASTRQATVHENWVVTPDNTSEYIVSGSGASNLHAINDSATAAANLALDYDGTGYNKANSTIGTVGSLGAGSIGNTTFAAGAIDAAAVASDIVAEIVDEVWDELTAGHVTASTFGKFFQDQLDATISSRATPAQVNSEVVDVVRTDAPGELSATPAAAEDLHTMIQFIYMMLRNENTQNGSLNTVKNDAGTVISQAATSDVGGTFTKQKYGNP